MIPLSLDLRIVFAFQRKTKNISDILEGDEILSFVNYSHRIIKQTQVALGSYHACSKMTVDFQASYIICFGSVLRSILGFIYQWRFLTKRLETFFRDQFFNLLMAKKLDGVTFMNNVFQIFKDHSSAKIFERRTYVTWTSFDSKRKVFERKLISLGRTDSQVFC